MGLGRVRVIVRVRVTVRAIIKIRIRVMVWVRAVAWVRARAGVRFWATVWARRGTMVQGCPPQQLLTLAHPRSAHLLWLWDVEQHAGDQCP